MRKACLIKVVSIPYRYKQNVRQRVMIQVICLKFQSPIGTNKTLLTQIKQFIDYNRFNPLQVQTKLSQYIPRARPNYVSIPYRYKQNSMETSAEITVWSEFQSPIGTNKTYTIVDEMLRSSEFQSPIGTNKTKLLPYTLPIP